MNLKYIIHPLRILLGLLFVVFGANAFLHFIPMPPPPAGDASDFSHALMNSGYMYFIAALQIIGGLCLLLPSRFVALGLTLLGPVIVNILLFHIFLNRSGLPLAIVISLGALFLLWVYRYKFPAIFEP